MSELQKMVSILENKIKKDNLHEAYRAEMKKLDDTHNELTGLINGVEYYANAKDQEARDKAIALRESVIQQKKATNKKAQELGLDVPDITRNFS